MVITSSVCFNGPNFPMVIFDFSIYNVIPVTFVGAVLIDGSCSDTSQCQTTNAQCPGSWTGERNDMSMFFWVYPG